MAYTRAVEVAKLIQSVVVDGVAVSISKRSVFVGVEVVVRGFRHDPEGLSRSWLIELFGTSSIELDLTIRALRKLGFALSGSSPEMKGRLTQALTKAERRSLETRKKEKAQAVTKAKEKAEITAETFIVKQDSDQKIKALAEQIIEIRQNVEDITLIKPRGERGRPGEAGADGKDGDVADLAEAQLSNIGDVSEEAAVNGQVLTWRDGQWCPRAIPSITSLANGGGGSSGGGYGGGSGLSHWTEDDDGNLIPTGQGTQSIGSETNRVKDLSITGGTITMDGLPLNIRAADSRLMFNGDLLAVGSEVPASIDELNDVDLATVAPVIGQTLLWDGSNWIPGAISGGGIADAPIDGNAYVRISGQWMLLSHAIQALVDAADFTTGDSGAITHAQLDGGNYRTGASDAGEPSGQNGSNGGSIP